MAKKKETETDGTGTEVPVENSDTENVDVKPKTKPKKNNKGDGGTMKKTLVELFNESPVDNGTLIMRLAQNGYLQQYEDELKKMERGQLVEATMTVEEFRKIAE